MGEQSIFIEALEKEDPVERAAFLDRACAADPDLRPRIERLFRRHEQADELLDGSLGWTGVAIDQPIAEGPGTTIGSYKLLELIGEGGMGTVYMAEQFEPVRRRVALKVIKPGMDSRQVNARFEAERQVLAMMDHPNIAKVHDGGATVSGRPYFVMELVKGIPITDYCDQAFLSIPDRLELFVLVCRAVQHAHQKGIIHRDLKPSNILVTLHDGVPVPKVIDFGVAKATGPGLTDKSFHTGFAQLVGTPLYMSPEQAALSGLDVDTRSDIYSLGVLLYELLTGTTPFDSETLKQAAFDEMRRIIREDEPPRPSTRLSTLGKSLTMTSARRGSDPRLLNRSVRGELDWIAMKALEKDRRRRYETANDFAADVMLYLSDQPVQACPPSSAYRFRKFARRNRAAMTTAAVLVISLSVGTAMSIWQAVLARRAEADTRAFSDFLVDDVLAAARPKGLQGGLGVGVTVAEALEAAESKLEERFSGRPLAEATASHAIGQTWRNLMKFEQAERHLLRSVELRERELGPNDSLTLDSRNSLGVLLGQMGRSAEAIATHQENLRRRTATLGPEAESTLTSMNNLAGEYQSSDNYSKALSLYEDALDIGQRTFGEENVETLHALVGLADLYVDEGRYAEALPLHERALEIRRRVLGPDHPDTLASMTSLGALYGLCHKDLKAHALLVEVLEISRRVHGVENPGTLDAIDSLAAHYRDHRDFDKAELLFVEALEVRRRLVGEDNDQTLKAMNNLAAHYWSTRRLDRSIPLFEEVLQRSRAAFGTDDLGTLQAMANLGINYRDAGRRREGIGLLEEAWRIVEDRPGPKLEFLSWVPKALAATYDQEGHYEQSEPIYRAALEEARKQGVEAWDMLAGPLYELGWNQLKQGEYAEAESLLSECLAIIERAEPDDWTTFHARSLLGGSLLGQKRYAEAEPLLLTGYEGMKQREETIPSSERIRMKEAVQRLVNLHEQWGHEAKADEWRGKLTETELARPDKGGKD